MVPGTYSCEQCPVLWELFQIQDSFSCKTSYGSWFIPQILLSVHVCEKTLCSSLIVTTTVVLRVIESSHLYSCWYYVAEPRRGGERRRSCRSSPSLDAGIFTIHQRSAPLP
ncbi:hypothetical protein YC2023_101400 [Brassica napus]|uniref:(rape) hypothetical protein n=1 Tax=Brassica napus TaxID=3708 RepID=A0A816UG53_BRANA|nr:unnamed protein product [Brassica napus]